MNGEVSEPGWSGKRNRRGITRLSKKSERCVYLGCNLLNSLDPVSQKAPQKGFFDSLNLPVHLTVHSALHRLWPPL